ncbi:MAG: LysM peptidoglycan-binding domain-containing protein [Verrucomicrobiales bacterium]|nr:LysM peptidoglycan-binding domain-containing protein [Verrucomicrobiales bacterium]
MKPLAIAFCLFYAACCIHETFGQQVKEVVKPIPTLKKEEAPEKPKETAQPKTYVVQSGDNPWLIAKKHGIELSALLKANDIKDPKNLKIGDRLTLPEGVASKNAPKPEAKPVAKPVGKPVSQPQSGDDWEMYTIKKGDNPWTISKALKVNHQKIMKLNEGLDFTKLSIGQQIKVPKKQ